MIASNYSCLVNVIEQLEARDLTLKHSLTLVDSVVTAIVPAPCKEGEEVRAKLGLVLSKNNGYKFAKKIQTVLDGGDGIDEILSKYTLDEILHFKYAPLTSIEVERSFSRFKQIFSCRRHSFKMPHLAGHLAIDFNNSACMYIVSFNVLGLFQFLF